LPELDLNSLGLGQRIAASQTGGPETALGPDRLDAGGGGTTKQIANLLRFSSVAGQNTIEQNQFCGSVLDFASYSVEGIRCEANQQTEYQRCQRCDPPIPNFTISFKPSLRWSRGKIS
jgi:hypothetical protein